MWLIGGMSDSGQILDISRIVDRTRKAVVRVRMDTFLGAETRVFSERKVVMKRSVNGETSGPMTR